MSKFKISKSNIIYLIIIALLIIPQTRLQIQLLLNKGLAMFSPSAINTSEQVTLTDYKWELMDKNNNVLGFESTKGKVVFVNFWATWCPSCIAEMPSMQALYNDYKDKVVFVFVSNEKFSKIDAFMEKKGYSLSVYNPITKNPETFKTSTIPRTFLIDKAGHIVIDKTGAANWNSDTVRATIDKLLQ